MRSAGAFLLAGTAALVPSAGRAQIEQSLDRTFSVPARSVTLTVSNDLFYDTNVARGGDAAARLRGIENEDVRAVPSASLDMTLPRGRALLTARGSIGYDAYARNRRLNRERSTFGVQAKLPVAFCTVTPDVAYARRQSDLLDLSIIPDATGQAAENVQTLKEVGAALLCGPDIGIRPSAYVRYAENENSARLRRGQDVEERRYGTALNYAQPSVGIITIFVERRDFTYDQRRRLTPAQVSTFRITSAGVRFDRRLGAPLQFAGSLSYSDLASPVSFRGAERYDGLNWDLSATLRLGGRVLLAAETDRDIAVSPGFSSDFIRQTNYVGSFTYALTPLVQVGASLSRAERNFRLIGVPTGFSITRDRIDAATLRLDYARRQVRMSVRGSYQRRDSDNDLFDYEGAQATLSVSYMFKRQ